MTSRSRRHLDLDLDLDLSCKNLLFYLCKNAECASHSNVANDVIQMLQMMSSNVALLHSNSCCVVLEPAICEDLDLHVAIFPLAVSSLADTNGN